jgi:CBS domain-containing protein
VKVRDVMTKDVVSISPDASAYEAAKKMKDENIGSLLVMDNKKLLGIITDRLIALSVVAEGLNSKKVKVKDFMFESEVSLLPDMDLKKAAMVLEELEIRYLPVVEDDRVVGILSVSDIANFVEHFIDCIFAELGVRARKRKGT